MSRTAALLLPLLAGCGPSEQVRVVVVGAEVRSECVDGGTCGWQEVSVGHCGPGVGVPQRAGAPARAVTDTPAKDVAAVVTVRHLAGDMPHEAANGGNARGWLLGATARANVEALYRADVTLYSLDATGEPLEPRADWLVARDGGLLQFAYVAAGRSVTEAHQVLEVGTRPFERISPNDMAASCCAAVPAPVLAGWLGAAVLVLALRRRRR